MTIKHFTDQSVVINNTCVTLVLRFILRVTLKIALNIIFLNYSCRKLSYVINRIRDPMCPKTITVSLSNPLSFFFLCFFVIPPLTALPLILSFSQTLPRARLLSLSLSRSLSHFYTTRIINIAAKIICYIRPKQ